jgi:hypothetical protein
MNYLKLLTAGVLLAAALPLGAANAQGPGPCTPPMNSAVGAAGPAMNSGQLMAGVGQCAPIGGWNNARGYGYRGGYGVPQAVQPPAAQYDSGYGGNGYYPY